MATFLDISLLGSAKLVFTFLLTYVIVWGVLVWSKPFGKGVGTGPYAIIALVAAFFTIVSRTVRFLVEWMTPWFLFLVLFFFFILLIVRMFGLSDSAIEGLIKNPSVYYIVIALIVIITLFGLGSAFGQRSLEASRGGAGATVPPSTSEPAGILQPVTPGPEGEGAGVEAAPALHSQPGTPGATATPNFSLNAINTLLHPKVLGIIAMILIATFSVWLLSRGEYA